MLRRIRFWFSLPGKFAILATPRVVEHFLHTGVVLEPGQFLLECVNFTLPGFVDTRGQAAPPQFAIAQAMAWPLSSKVSSEMLTSSTRPSQVWSAVVKR